MEIDRIHHVAYRCKDAKETVLWYQRVLKMDFVPAIAEALCPRPRHPIPTCTYSSTRAAGSGNVLAFFELPTQPPMGRDPNTPAWLQNMT
jgi:catechol 2,3-dioxygenase-like lactoylglutathione lyase family enzyme